mgnify:CR=1 FL=1
MKKYLLFISFISACAFAQQPIEITYDAVNREFQQELQKLFVNFSQNQASMGNEVLITFCDNLGEMRVSESSAGAPSYLRAISSYKVKFLKDRQLLSTQGVYYFGNTM